MKKYIKIVVVGILFFSVYSCNNQDSFTESIFTDVPVLDTLAATYPFDKWLYDNYTVPYNVDFRYKLQDVSTDINYNLVPAALDKAQSLAVLVKYLWFDVYSKIGGEDFLKYNGLRIINLIGSPAINADLGTEILGTAEGGIKVTLYKCNTFSPTNIDEMNEYYFKTMHHEYGHILQQKKSPPRDFDGLSAGYYDPTGWQFRSDAAAASIGCLSPYASSEPKEDWVEVIANYIVKSDAWWKNRLAMAANPGKDGIPNNLKMRGDSIIITKLAMCTEYLKKSWNIDLQTLHNEVQERQTHVVEILNEKYW